MNLTPYVEELHRQLAAAAEAHSAKARAHAERLAPALDASARLMLLDALSAAATEITTELAPGSVDLRLRAGEPEFVVALPAAEIPEAAPAEPPPVDEAATARINLRLPDRLKSRVEDAAAASGLSVNAWLVRVIAAAVEGGSQTAAPSGRQRYTGWVS
jgi:hypothetical protein